MRTCISHIASDDAADLPEMIWLMRYGHLFRQAGIDNAREAYRVARIMGLSRRRAPGAMMRPAY
jgi:hypothetical protein